MANILIQFVTSPINISMIVLCTIGTILLWRKANETKSIQLRNYCSTLWTSVGILGTFVSIYISLSGMDFTSANNNAIESLIQNIIPAFSTSIIGIVGAIICTICNKLSIAKAEEVEENDFTNTKNRFGVHNKSNSPELILLEIENLKEINSMGNSLQTISLSNLPQLRYYNCKSNSLKSLSFLRGCSSLKTLCCSNNRFEHLDCSWLTALDSIDFSRCNKLKSVPILPVGIKKVICSNVPIIANIDWAMYTELMWLEASNCELTTFDASKCSSSLEVLCLLGNHIMELDLSTLNRLDWRTSSLWQEVKLPAVYREDRSMWEVFLPASFDFTRVESVDGRYMGGSPSRGDTGTPTHVGMECFTDENGQKRCSFFTDRIKRGYDRYGNSTTPFFYRYKTNNSGVPSFGVEVVGYQVPSGVEDLAADKTVKGVVYYDLQGHESAVPFSGFNIEVTQFTDGTSQSKKVVK